MRWPNRLRLRSAGKAKRADPRDETVIRGVPHDGRAASERLDSSAPHGDGADTQIAEEIKKRQIALAVRYVTRVRAR